MWLVMLCQAGVGCLLLGFGIRLGVQRTTDDPPTVQPLDRPPSPPTDYSSLPGYPPAPPERKPW